MKTYTAESFKDEAALDWRKEREKIRAVFEEEDEDGLLARLLAELKKYFPVDHILLSYSSPQKEQNQYHFYPPVLGKRKDYRFITTREQRFVIERGAPCVVHIGNRFDHSMSLGLIRNLLPNVDFSMLMFRMINQHEIICGFSFVSKKPDAYSKSNARFLFRMQDVFCAWFEKRSPLLEGTENSSHKNLLPLTMQPGMQRLSESIWAIARQDCPVLLLGETGTGKEVIADTIYRASPRVYGPFIKINCGSIPENLVDSELFGHERGSFTGADNTTRGCFEQADLGALMLDEIGELSLSAQTRLLRVLQEGTVLRVGDFKPIDVDVRVIAATHRNLMNMVQDGKFREDLFYRLNVFPLYVPALRERPEDIKPLLWHFITTKCEKNGWDIPMITQSNMDDIITYSWPGNVRELQNAVEHALILWSGSSQRKFHIYFGEQLFNYYKGKNAQPVNSPAPLSSKIESMEAVIANHIRHALQVSGGKVNGVGGAAELLDINPNTLRSRMRRYGIEVRK